MACSSSQDFKLSCKDGHSVLSLNNEMGKEENNMTEGVEFSSPPQLDISTSASVMMMRSYFDFLYAKALCEVKTMTVRKNCYGCQTNHPSQREHDCLMICDDEEYQLEFYFEDMLKEVDENAIIRSWEEMMAISNITPEMVFLHKRVIESKDFLAIMKTDQWKAKMKKMVLTITQIEDRLFRCN
jgi:hypothetical protein